MQPKLREPWPGGLGQHPTSETTPSPQNPGAVPAWAHDLPRRYRLALLAGLRNNRRPSALALPDEESNGGNPDDIDRLSLPIQTAGHVGARHRESASVRAGRLSRRVSSRFMSLALIGGLVLGVMAFGGLFQELASTREQLEEARKRLEVSEQRHTITEERVRATEGQLKAQGESLSTALNTALSAAEQAVSKPAPAPTGENIFPGIFVKSRNAMLFIRTEYVVRLLLTGQEQTLQAYGTGFFISPDGVALTAQHVIYPWRYEKPLQASVQAGMVEVLEDRVQITAWPTDVRVTEDGDEEPRFLFENGYRLGGDSREIDLLASGHYVTMPDYISTPVGVVEIALPKLGRGDWVMFKVRDSGRSFAHLSFAGRVPGSAPLDEVLVMGYPLSRLAQGYAEPSPSRGRVRRSGPEVLELDSPLHPGNSGGPILNQDGRVIGLASAVLDSPVYGIAVPAGELRQAWRKVRSDLRLQMRDRQMRLLAMGCNPGPIDGLPGPRTLRAQRCADALAAAQTPEMR